MKDLEELESVLKEVVTNELSYREKKERNKVSF